MRVVLDANVLLAGLATHGLCEALIAACFDQHVVVTSEHILREVTEHYVGKFKATDDQAAAVVDAIRGLCEVVSPSVVEPTAFDDADDLPVLGTALAGQVDALITGDKRLRALNQFHGIPLLSPREFCDRLRADG